MSAQATNTWARRRRLRRSDVSGRLETIDHHKDIIDPIVRDEVSRPRPIQVTVGAEQPDTGVVRREHLSKLFGQPSQLQQPREAVRPGRGSAGPPPRNGRRRRSQELGSLSIRDSAELSDAIELSSYCCFHGSSSTTACHARKGQARTYPRSIISKSISIAPKSTSTVWSSDSGRCANLRKPRSVSRMSSRTKVRCVTSR